MNISKIYVLFMIYSMIGWLIETLYIYARTKKLVDRGFLIGPYCPIYGWGCILITLLLDKYTNSPIILFCMSIVICSILEYFTSYLLEKIFKIRWWDYSKRKYNINGRICLETMIPFGILGTLIMYFVNPILVNFVNKINYVLLNIISIIVFIIFLIDNIISYGIVSKFSKEVKTSLKDETSEIKKYAKELFSRRWFLHIRIKDAFPNLKIKIERLKEKI